MHIALCLIVENLLEFEFADEVACGLSRKFCHIGEINAALLLHGDRQGIGCTLRLGRDALRDDRALRENICLADKILLAVIDFIGGNEVAAGIDAEELLERLILHNAPIAAHMILITLRELLLEGIEFFIGTLLLLRAQERMTRIAQMDGRNHARPILLGHLRHTARALRIHKTECPILYIEAHRGALSLLLLHRNGQRLRGGRIDASRKRRQTLSDRSTKILPLGRKNGLLAPVCPRPRGELPQHLCAVVIKILVDVLPSRRVIDNTLPVHGGKSILLLLGGRTRRIFFPKDKQIGNNACARSRKRRFGKTQRSDKTRLIGEHTAYTLVILVHCPLRGDRDHKSPGAHLVNHLVQKVVMDTQPLAEVFRIARDDLIAKRHVADGKIERPVGKACPFKSLLRDFCVRMCEACNAGRERIDLHADETALLPHFLRHRVKETPRAARRLQHIPPGKSDMGKPLIDSRNDLGRRVVRV